ncbi:zinc-binding alcohol dehydrogenase [Rhizobium sp. RU36D]|uniref:zinc-dependent alcohol dehydrogenase n=1 Tax=Rhizobium sp. RU36D TaxID=1907415 RepID=UPI0009D8A372|nr:zinc-binding alcohol dehydrogenase [Rhizobium sp. RU36D]SMC53126.1 2-desacetyl-2-hydroxyethyl bacteriochlorophyllide A dehydrogenase [Rhizobium sp. RU36D]
MEESSVGFRSRSLWIAAAQRCEIREEALAAPLADQALVRMLFSGVSRGTENLVFAGRVPVSEFERMRGPHMGGGFPFPVKYGYAAAGWVEAGPEELVGTSVFCLHPHQDLFVVDAASLVAIPHGVPVERAVLAPNMETALNIVWDAGVQPGDRVAVFGAGVVGALVAYIASRIIGTEVHLVDRNSARRSLADRLCIGFSTDAEVSGEFDVLINASGSGEALSRAIEVAGQEARIIEASWHGDRPVSLPLGGAFHARRLTIASSQVGSVPPDRRARWSYGRRLAKALDLLRDDCLDALISGETDFSTLETDYPAVLANPDTLCHRIRYTSEKK